MAEGYEPNPNYTPDGTMIYSTAYPNGKQYGADYFELYVPFYNPSQNNKTVTSAYVYDSNGNITDIKSSVSVNLVTVYYVKLHITFNANYVGKLLRVGVG